MNGKSGRVFFLTALVVMFFSGGGHAGFSVIDPVRFVELDRNWREVARSLRQGDFQGYKPACHESGQPEGASS